MMTLQARTIEKIVRHCPRGIANVTFPSEESSILVGLFEVARFSHCGLLISQFWASATEGESADAPLPSRRT